jgi:hypothetical protein
MTPAVIAALIQLLVTYGPEAVSAIIALMKKQTITIDDVETAFAALKPYSAYNIPDLPDAPAATDTPEPAGPAQPVPPAV